MLNVDLTKIMILVHWGNDRPSGAGTMCVWWGCGWEQRDWVKEREVLLFHNADSNCLN